MANYIITGKLGAGKTLAAAHQMQAYLLAGRRVATNIDIKPELMVGPRRKTQVFRLPDKPRVEDLDAMGLGTDSKDYDEEQNGALVLDELGTWLNTRNFTDKSRKAVIDWFLHARKKRWNVYLIVQDVEMIDKQVRTALCEHLIITRRLDRLPIPLLGSLMGLLSLPKPRLPRMHICKVHYGETEEGMVVDRWVFRGTDLYPAYDTTQCFTEDTLTLDPPLSAKHGQAIDMRALYQLLTPWHLVGRYQTPLLTRLRQALPSATTTALCCSLLALYFTFQPPTTGARLANASTTATATTQAPAPPPAPRIDPSAPPSSEWRIAALMKYPEGWVVLITNEWITNTVPYSEHCERLSGRLSMETIQCTYQNQRVTANSGNHELRQQLRAESPTTVPYTGSQQTSNASMVPGGR